MSNTTLPPIDETKPQFGMAYTADQRANWSATKAWFASHDTRLLALEAATDEGGAATGPITVQGQYLAIGVVDPVTYDLTFNPPDDGFDDPTYGNGSLGLWIDSNGKQNIGLISADGSAWIVDGGQTFTAPFLTFDYHAYLITTGMAINSLGSFGILNAFAAYWFWDDATRYPPGYYQPTGASMSFQGYSSGFGIYFGACDDTGYLDPNQGDVWARIGSPFWHAFAVEVEKDGLVVDGPSYFWPIDYTGQGSGLSIDLDATYNTQLNITVLNQGDLNIQTSLDYEPVYSGSLYINTGPVKMTADDGHTGYGSGSIEIYTGIILNNAPGSTGNNTSSGSITLTTGGIYAGNGDTGSIFIGTGDAVGTSGDITLFPGVGGGVIRLNGQVTNAGN